MNVSRFFPKPLSSLPTRNYVKEKEIIKYKVLFLIIVVHSQGYISNEHLNDTNISINRAISFFSIISFKAISRFIFINAFRMHAALPSYLFIPLADRYGHSKCCHSLRMVLRREICSDKNHRFRARWIKVRIHAQRRRAENPFSVRIFPVMILHESGRRLPYNVIN